MLTTETMAIVEGIFGSTMLSKSTTDFLTQNLNPEGVSSTAELAETLSNFFKSDAFTAHNFTELGSRRVAQLKWTATKVGFRHLNEILGVLSCSDELKGLTACEIEEKVRQFSMGEFTVREDLAELFAPIVRKIRSHLKKRQQKVHKQTIRTSRAGTYVPRTTFIWGPTNDDPDMLRMKFEAETYRPPSLIELITQERDGQSLQPVSFGIINQDPKREPLPTHVIERFNHAGIAIFKEKVGVPLILDTVPLAERYDHMLRLTAGHNHPSLKFGELDWEYINSHNVWTPAAKWLFRCFSDSIDSTYLPSIVTAGIEPSTFCKQNMMFAQTTDEYGTPTGMDGGGWLPPYKDGKPTNDIQVRGLLAISEREVAYVKGMMFAKWDCCTWQTPEGQWMPFWTNAGREAAEAACGLAEQDLLAAYNHGMKSHEKGYPDFVINNVRFRALPIADINQVKGLGKATVKSLIDTLPVYPGYMGALRVQNTPANKMGFCFEALQWLQADLSTEETGECPVKLCIDHYQRRLIQELAENGLDGLAQRASNQDTGIETVLSVLEVLNAHQRGAPEITWQDIPNIRSRVISSLEKELYWGGEGGGIETPQIYYQLSNQIPQGFVLCTKYKPGTRVGTCRFPMSSPSALCVLTVLDPADYPHHHTNIDIDTNSGDTPPTRCIMNPSDLTSAMQGDDDGDTGGITDHPLVVTACQKKWENRVFSVEVIGTTKLKEPLWSIRPNAPMETMPDGREIEAEYSPSGMVLAARDRRGNVGMATRLQQWAESLRWQNGEYSEEASELCILMAWLIQAEIDMEKKTTLALNFGNAWRATLSECCTEKNGVWSIKPEFIAGQGSGIEACMKLVQDFMIRSGCYSTYTTPDGEVRKKAANPIGWYNRSKKVDLNSTNWAGAQYWPEEGLRIDSTLHWSFRNMERLFNEIRPMLNMEIDAPRRIVSLRSLMYDALRTLGHEVTPIAEYTDTAYQRMQRRTGSATVRKELGKASNSNGENAVQDRVLQVLQNQQEHLRTLSLQELSDAWALECWYFESFSKSAQETEDDNERKYAQRRAESALNAASRLVAFVDSPLAIALGINNNSCTWITPRIQSMIETTYDKDETVQSRNFTAWIAQNGHLHATHPQPDGISRHMIKCPTCTQAAQDALVRKTREAKHKYAIEFYAKLNTHVNS